MEQNSSKVPGLGKGVERECPIHYELLCKRVATLFGNIKATVKVRNSVEYVLNKNLKDVVIKKGDFCW